MWKIKIEFCFITLVVWAASIVADDPMEVQVALDSTEGPFGCPVRPSLIAIKVRFQSLKTSSDLVFHRRTVDEDLFACYEGVGFEELSAADMSDCAEATAAAGLEMYRWEDGNCTGYAVGIPKDTNCVRNEAVVLYSVDVVSKARENIALTLHRSLSSIWAEWSKCHPDYPSNEPYFSISWNGTTIQLNSTTFEYRLQHVDLCTDNLTHVDPGLLEVTLEAFDDNGNPAITADTKKIVTEMSLPGSRYRLKSGNCLYYEDDQRFPWPMYDVLEEFCRSTLSGTMFIEYKDGDFATYSDDLADLQNRTSLNIYNHYVGLLNDGSNWTWLSGLPQEEDDEAVWSKGIPYQSPCALMSSSNLTLFDDECDDWDTKYACHEIL